MYEDIIIDNALNNISKGVYIAIGAYDPSRFNNTKRFYLRGWRGVNIEPDTNNFAEFVIDRKKDINLNVGIGTKNKKLTFYKFYPSTLSTFFKKRADNYVKQSYRLIAKEKISVVMLAYIFKKYIKHKVEYIYIYIYLLIRKVLR